MPGAVADSRSGALSFAAASLDDALARPLRPAPPAVRRLREAAACLLLTAVAFGQSPERISGDTKLDLTHDPAGWAAGGLLVWSADALGSLQNQAYGYLFPMGPFHWAGVAAGLPIWVVQRLWWSVLLVTAFLGVLRLAGRVGIGTPGGHVLAGLAYALSPRVLTELGGLSSEVVPHAALPWVLLPLAGPAAELAPRLAAMRSGVAVLFMGAVNAAATVVVLVLPVLWLLSGLRRPDGRRLAAWWLLAVALASAWWVVPLLVQGAYAPPFLDYIETASTTTMLTSPVEVLRGTSHWLAYLAVSGDPWWRAGWTLVTVPAVILNTAVVAGLGVAGLATRSMPVRGRLVAGALIAVAAMSLGHDGALGGPLVEPVRSLLDGPLAPFRNVHKLDPVLRLSLVLGLCHVLTLLPDVRPRRQLAFVAALGVAVTATPALAGQLAPAGSFREVPTYWQRAAEWVDERSAGTSTLLVPAAGDAEHVWGRPLEDPLQVLADSPVVVRDAVPLGGPEVTRLLDAVGARLDTGRGSAGLAPVLARSGIRHVVVRNDLDRSRTTAPLPALVSQALRDSPGLTRVRTFGPRLGNDAIRDGLVADRGLDERRPAVEVWAVDAPVAPVAVYPRSGAWLLDGGPDALLQLADRGLLGPQDGVVRVGDGDPGERARTAVTDGLRKRSRDVGRVRENESVTRTADEDGDALLPGEPAERLVIARWSGVREVTASSSAADPGALLSRGAEHAPAAAVDGDSETTWISGSAGDGPVGQWLQVDLDTPTAVDGVAVLPATTQQSPLLRRIVEVEVSTDTGTARTRLQSDGLQPLVVPPGPTTTFRLTVTEVAEGVGPLVGLRELRLPEVEVGRTVVLPAGAPLHADSVHLVDKPVGSRDACLSTATGVRCSPDLLRRGEEPGSLDRTVTYGQARRVMLSGGARPRLGPALERLLDDGAPVRVTASSRAVADPRGRPAAVVDGDRGTGWHAAGDDEQPELRLEWDGERVVDGLHLDTGALAAARPLRVRVTTDAGSVERAVPTSGRVRFPAAATSSVQVRVLVAEDVVDVGPAGRLSALPVGLAELSVDGLEDLLPVTARNDEPVMLGCGKGPRLDVGDTPVGTRVLGTRGDLVDLRPMLLAACTPDGAVDVQAEEIRVVAARDDLLDVTALTLGPALPQPPQDVRTVEVGGWETEHRTVRVGPGAEAWLAVHESRNRGWRAVLDGTELEPARLDGWQQGFVIPAGSGGEVRLEYRPGRVHRGGLLVGLAAAMVLCALALRSRRPRELATVRRAAPRRVPVAAHLLPLLLLVGLGGVAGAAIWAGALLLVRRARDWVPLVAGLAVVVAGGVVAWAPWSGPREPGALSAAAAVPALLAIALLAVAWVSDRRAAHHPVGISAGTSAASAGAPAPPRPAG